MVSDNDLHDLNLLCIDEDLKRVDKLDMITEKILIGDKIEEIKEKISDIRNR